MVTKANSLPSDNLSPHADAVRSHVVFICTMDQPGQKSRAGQRRIEFTSGVSLSCCLVCVGAAAAFGMGGEGVCYWFSTGFLVLGFACALAPLCRRSCGMHLQIWREEQISFVLSPEISAQDAPPTPPHQPEVPAVKSFRCATRPGRSSSTKHNHPSKGDWR
ncbi:MAG: hypothetical protein ABIY70_08825 [Capsulimonas sp.]|uniref:hypothetical protein n=1 Tax=Capsulimonas sp. TaxID=2494211 RepID=UPI00326797A7